MLTSPRRLLSAALAIVLGVGFVAASLMLATSMDATVRAAAGGAIRDAKVLITQDPESGEEPRLTQAYVDALATVPGVDRVRPTVNTYAMSVGGGNIQTVQLQTLPDLTDRTTLVTGRLPETAGEVLVNQPAANVRHWQPGTTVALEGKTTQEFTVVGVVDAASDTTTDPASPHVFATMADIARLSDRTYYTDVYVHGSASVTESELLTAVAALPATRTTGAAVLTASEASDVRVRQFTRGSEQLTVMLLAFGAIAVIVAGLVVANTFAILVAQRTRQLALLRTIGATQGQVFRTVLVEAAGLGLIASLAGTALGAAAVAAMAPFSRSSNLVRIEHLAVTPRDIIVPLLVGTLLALGAALVPARQATRIPPLAAMRPQVATAVDPRLRQERPVWALVATGVGFGLLVVGAVVLPMLEVSTGMSVLVGIAGGLFSVVGVLALGRVLIPSVARLLAAGLRRLGGTSAELAAENAVRNPRRAAATAGALLVGVTLVTMMTVGAATGQATVQRELDRYYPVDVQASPIDRITSAQVERARSLPDVAAATMLWEGGTETTDGAHWVPLVGFEPDAAGTLRDRSLVAGLADGVLLAGPKLELTEGASITLTGARPMTLTVKVTPALGARGAVTAATLLALQPDAHGSLGLRLADGVDAVEAVNTVAESLGAVGPAVSIMSAAEQRAQMEQVVDTVLLVVLGLLAVAVVIAIVGIGNTLGLSVHERRQELGLLRAMGLTRGQLRASLGWEAVLLAAVAVVLGLGLGIAYALAGVSSVMAADVAVVPAVPWLRVALIAAVALLAGWVASVLPSIRAAKVPPAAALALGE